VSAALSRAREAMEIAERAHEGPWEVGDGMRTAHGVRTAPPLVYTQIADVIEELAAGLHDARFIARTRTLLPQLARDVVEAHKEIERLRDQSSRLHGMVETAVRELHGCLPVEVVNDMESGKGSGDTFHANKWLAGCSILHRADLVHRLAALAAPPAENTKTAEGDRQ